MTRIGYAARYYQQNRESCRSQQNQYHKAYIRRLKKDVISAYGGCCVCCGESELVFLTLDHVNGGGGKHRKQNKAAKIYQRLRRLQYPEALDGHVFRVLCFNCNWAVYRGGCPHGGI